MSAGRTRLLVVDDEPQIHRFLGPALDAAGYDTIRAETGEEALRLAATRQPSLVLLDLGLPDIDGQVVIQRLRQFIKAPIVVVSARGQEEEKVAALDAGADDYVEKPFALAELLARIRVALRRATNERAEEAVELHVGPLSINVDQRIARIEGDEPLHLTPREWALLVTLARARGRVMTQQQLLTAVWGPAHADEAQYLRVYVGHLRQKLGRAAGLLKTEPGVGYRFSE
ncbi:response regulator [Pseudoroseomonas wenyumeiae]|uniref:Response regulator n=1 Tax=Teichococcus wenyumeiae TaxID=2478470 RepID=A0A3A9J840_9PROT|nr:response regulator transcription factor [Pseudoroseomonas wenyumeiae]RKK03427.1 DNA-binding response regulator [Pseudoroseomonas wenyumeiae]RMI25130.1 response regulator [Pseudoroseomonas wenyumeiae]